MPSFRDSGSRWLFWNCCIGCLLRTGCSGMPVQDDSSWMPVMVVVQDCCFRWLFMMTVPDGCTSCLLRNGTSICLCLVAVRDACSGWWLLNASPGSCSRCCFRWLFMMTVPDGCTSCLLRNGTSICLCLVAVRDACSGWWLLNASPGSCSRCCFRWLFMMTVPDGCTSCLLRNGTSICLCRVVVRDDGVG